MSKGIPVGVGGRAVHALPAAAVAWMIVFSAPAAAPAAFATGAAVRLDDAAAEAPAAARATIRPGAPLPDTVLARVGGHRDITARQLLSRWRQTGAPATDSLTPAEARRFLQLLICQELVAEAALREPWVWTEAESSEIRTLEDGLTLVAALDSVLSETRAGLAVGSGGAPVDGIGVGVIARDSTVARLSPVFDRALLERMAAAWAELPRPDPDSSLAAQLRALERLPRIAERDTGLVVARSAAGEVRVADLMSQWARLRPTQRPRVETADQLEDLVRNQIFQDALRREIARQGLAKRPDIAGRVQKRRERIAVGRYVRREVTDSIAPDEEALRRHHGEHADDWSVPTRVRAVRLALPTRAEASRMAVTLRDPAEAESLVARAARAGIAYRVEASAAGDSALFAAGLTVAPGTVVGPVEGADGWWTARIEAVLPGHTRPFEQVRAEVEAAWRAREAERRIEEMCEGLRPGIPVGINEEALGRVSGGP